MPNLVRAATLTNYAELARQLGLDPARLLRKHGLNLKMLADPEQQIPVRPVLALLEESAQLAECPSFGLLMAESRQLADVGFVSLLFSHQRTLRDVLQAIVHYQHMLHDAVAVVIEDAGETIIVHEEIVLSGAQAPSRQGIELALGVLWRVCRAVTGPHWHPRGVRFSHGAPPDLRVHRRVFGCTPEFGCEWNGLVCSAADLERPNPGADPALAGYAERFVDTLPGARSSGQSVEFEVRRAIQLMLPMGCATIEQVAQGLGINVRTLQRRLDAGGASFSGLVDEARGELALRYMENPELPLTRIAEFLGYATPSSFTRWFIARFGMAPAAWRKTGSGVRSKRPVR